MQRMKRLVVVMLTALLLSALVPTRARAFDTTPLIIGAASAGVVLVIGLIAILAVAGEDDEEIMPLLAQPPQPAQADGRIRFASDCAPTADTRPLMCW